MIKSINLADFRNFRKKKFEFSPKTTIIIGPNASGKTNILEGLSLLATGKSFRANLEEEMIKYEEDLARVRSADPKLEVILTRGNNDWPRKKLLLNGVPKRLLDFAGVFKTVLFGPWDMGLVTESPSLRRRFLDGVLFQVDREYRRAILSYEKGLRQRNRLLLRIRDEGLSRSQLLFWNQLLIKTGDYISQRRQELIKFINSTSALGPTSFVLDYDKSSISEGRLEQYAEEEVASATTLVGPHRDDFVFNIFNHKSKILNLAAFGSRGEQRMAILWLKLAELAFIEARTDEKPTLLLDDIFSELDHEHRRIIIDLIERKQTPLHPSGFAGQAIITTADEHFVKGLRSSSVIVL